MMDNTWQYSQKGVSPFGVNRNTLQNTNTQPYMEQQRTENYFDGMAQNQALEDNTLDFIPGAKIGSMFGATRQAGEMTARGLHNSQRYNMPFGDAMKDVSVGTKEAMMNSIFGTNKNRVKPSYREVDMSNVGHEGVFQYPMKGRNAGNIYVDKNLDDLSKGATKRHEYRHATDYKNNPDMFKEESLKRTRGKSKGEFDEWASDPAEMSAQGREMKYWQNKMNTSEAASLEEFMSRRGLDNLRSNTDRFVDDYAKRYPGREREILDAMDTHDNYFYRKQ